MFSVALLGLLAEVWFFLTVLSALRYLRDRDIATEVARLARAAANIYANAEFNPQAEIQRITVEYQLPPPPPAYSVEDLNQSASRISVASSAAQFAASFPPNDGPPGYEEACSSTEICHTNLAFSESSENIPEKEENEKNPAEEISENENDNRSCDSPILNA